MFLDQQDTKITSNLTDALRLRFTTADDIEPLAQFNGRIHGDGGFSETIAQWTREFTSPSHPTCGPDNVTVVEDTNTKKIVSSMCLIPQVWTYDGIPFPVGRPEAVGTDPAYRRRGLIRAQFDALHAKSKREGHLVQGITGIPWYYRQFDYEYALDLDGGWCVYPALIPPLKEGEIEAYRFRGATLADLPLVMELYNRDCARSLVACPRSEAEWRRTNFEVLPPSQPFGPVSIIETNEGCTVGMIRTGSELSWRGMFPVRLFAVFEGESLRAILPAVLRWLKGRAEAAGAAAQKPNPLIHFELGEQHPAYEAAPELFHQHIGSYAWYIRVPDVPKFLNHIAPVLEKRLAQSALNGYAGEIKVHEYVRGFKLTIAPGKISAKPWSETEGDEAQASFPPLKFLQVLFGYRSFEELAATYPDCFAKDSVNPLLKVLFPKRYSNVLPIG